MRLSIPISLHLQVLVVPSSGGKMRHFILLERFVKLGVYFPHQIRITWGKEKACKTNEQKKIVLPLKFSPAKAEMGSEKETHKKLS